jgi:hypothetical protein
LHSTTHARARIHTHTHTHTHSVAAATAELEVAAAVAAAAAAGGYAEVEGQSTEEADGYIHVDGDAEDATEYARPEGSAASVPRAPTADYETPEGADDDEQLVVGDSAHGYEYGPESAV